MGSPLFALTLNELLLNYTRFECVFPGLGDELVLDLQDKLLDAMIETDYTFIKVKTTLETSGEDIKLHSKRVGKILNYTRNEWRRY